MTLGTWTSKDLCWPPPPGGAHVKMTGILVVLVETANFGLTNSVRGRHRLVYLIIPPRKENGRGEKVSSPFPSNFSLGLSRRLLCYAGNWSPDSSLGVQLDLPQVDLKSVNRTKDFFESLGFNRPLSLYVLFSLRRSQGNLTKFERNSSRGKQHPVVIFSGPEAGCRSPSLSGE